jgi:hypothetical protein
VKANRWRRVKDHANRRVRGLWKRNDVFYVQTTITDPSTGLKKVSRLRLAEATDIGPAKTEAGKFRQRIAAGETVHGKQGPTFSEYREHRIKTAAGKKPKTLYSEDYFPKAWQEFLGADIQIGSTTKQNVLAFRVGLNIKKYSPRIVHHHVVTLRNRCNMAKIDGYFNGPLPTDGVPQLKGDHTEPKLQNCSRMTKLTPSAMRHSRSTKGTAGNSRISSDCRPTVVAERRKSSN